MKRRITDYWLKQTVKDKEIPEARSDEVLDTEFTTDDADISRSESSAPGTDHADASSDDDDLQGAERPHGVEKKRKYDHHFRQKWLGMFTWLNYDGKQMTCSICMEQKKSNAFTNGCTNFRTSTLSRHADSTDHRFAVKEDLQKKNLVSVTHKAIAKKTEAAVSAMRCVYWLAKEGLPISKYESLVKFCKLQGCTALNDLDSGKNATYLSWQTAEEILEAIVEVIVGDIDEQLKACKFMSVMIDESTDITVTKKLVIYGRTVTDNLEQQTFFLGNIPFNDAHINAKMVFEKLKTFLQSRGVEIHDKIYGFGSDGASIMVGRQTGVATQVKQENPHAINVHCFAHKLALCTGKAADSVPYIGKVFQRTMTDLYYYFKKSTCRKEELSKIQKVLELPEVKIKEVHEVRWFACYSALNAIYLSWKALVVYFKDIKKPNEKEKTLLKDLTDVKFIGTMHTLMDIIPAFTQLNIIFQKQDLDISIVQPAIDGAIDSAKTAKEGKGPHQRDFEEKLVKKKDKRDKPELRYKGEKLSNPPEKVKEAMSNIKEIRADFVDNLLRNVERRFPKESTEVAVAFKSFGMRPISYLCEEELDSYGRKDIEILANFYGNDQTVGNVVSKALVNGPACLGEWELAKKVVLAQKYPRDSLSILWGIINKYHKETFPNLLILAKLALSTPFQTADCERGFSCQNNLHTASRNKLKPSKLNSLMTVMIEGPEISRFDFGRAVAVWSKGCERRIFKKK